VLLYGAILSDVVMASLLVKAQTLANFGDTREYAVLPPAGQDTKPIGGNVN
jgi:hypothetical protein